MKNPRFLLILAIPAVLLLASCSSPFQNALAPGESPALTVRLPGRGSLSPATVIPDFSALVVEWRLTLRNQTDQTEREVTVGAGASEPVTMGDLYPGLWDLVVEGLSSDGTVVARGGDQGILLAPGASEERTPQIRFLQSGDPGTEGGFSLALAFPSGTGVDYLEATIKGHFSATPSLVVAGGTARTLLESTSIPGGSWPLKVVFRRGGASGAVAATLLETINVWDGVVSDRWIDTDGTLQTERLLDESFFLCPGVGLEELRLAPGELDPPFSPAVTTYTLSAGSAQQIALRGRGASTRQTISYRWNSSAPEPVQDDQTRIVSFPAGETTATLEVIVTAADRETTRTYTVQVVRP
ncbi:cadherin-like beta sandwich domain-containing protein [Alkalispirochaeta alkalica]|uniref:cadherin-like beta sandwich domain-containing protein n=1 Tax=Alkalispirochaeta alkalica TaxID=46356 RepID=UPI000378A849|nr:cadherin-like beta sandwich domain-containing protein [Alkalispirochaeta alkalica]